MEKTAVVLQAFPGVVDGETVQTCFEIGDTIEGVCAHNAVMNGWAAWDDKPETVDDYKAALDGLGVDYPASAKKPDLVALYDEANLKQSGEGSPDDITVEEMRKFLNENGIEVAPEQPDEEVAALYQEAVEQDRADDEGEAK